MKKSSIVELEQRYQLASSVDELIEIDEEYYSYLEDQIKEDPKNIQALVHLGVLSWEPFHKNEKAIEYLERAIKYDPKNIEARFWLAKCYYHDYCAYEKARQILLEALQIDPNRPEGLSLLALVIGDTTEDWNEAIAYLEKAIQYEPEWPMLRFSLGSRYLEIGEIALAELQAQKIQELSLLRHEKPKNGVEDYYESVVTGRNMRDIQESLGHLKERIRKKRILESFLGTLEEIPDEDCQEKVWILAEEPEHDDFIETIYHFFEGGDGILERCEGLGLTNEQYHLLVRFRDQLDQFVKRSNSFLEQASERDKIREMAKEILKAFNYRKK
jgi:tetratricopeptide (TPR) repeat protein